MSIRIRSAKTPASRVTATRVAKPVAGSAANLFLANQMCFAIYSTSLAMTKLYRPLLSRLGLTYPQYVVLLALWEQDQLTVTALGERVALDSGTLTPLLKRLQNQGLLERQRSLDDEREVYIKLTRQGFNLRKKSEAIHENIVCATQCSHVERKTLTQSLQKLRASLMANLPN